MTNAEIRDIFLAHGFTIKEGLADLKTYVYDAARALLTAERERLCRELSQRTKEYEQKADQFEDSIPESALHYDGMAEACRLFHARLSRETTENHKN